VVALDLGPPRVLGKHRWARPPPRVGCTPVSVRSERRLAHGYEHRSAPPAGTHSAFPAAGPVPSDRCRARGRRRRKAPATRQRRATSIAKPSIKLEVIVATSAKANGASLRSARSRWRPPTSRPRSGTYGAQRSFPRPAQRPARLPRDACVPRPGAPCCDSSWPSTSSEEASSSSRFCRTSSLLTSSSGTSPSSLERPGRRRHGKRRHPRGPAARRVESASWWTAASPKTRRSRMPSRSRPARSTCCPPVTPTRWSARPLSMPRQLRARRRADRAFGTARSGLPRRRPQRAPPDRRLVAQRPAGVRKRARASQRDDATR
jgi:hypothetical protein